MAFTMRAEVRHHLPYLEGSERSFGIATRIFLFHSSPLHHLHHPQPSLRPYSFFHCFSRDSGREESPSVLPETQPIASQNARSLPKTCFPLLVRPSLHRPRHGKEQPRVFQWSHKFPTNSSPSPEIPESRRYLLTHRPPRQSHTRPPRPERGYLQTHHQRGSQNQVPTRRQ